MKKIMDKKDFRKLKIALAEKDLTLKELLAGLDLNYRYVYNLIRQQNDAREFKKKLKSVYGIRL